MFPDPNARGCASRFLRRKRGARPGVGRRTFAMLVNDRRPCSCKASMRSMARRFGAAPATSYQERRFIPPLKREIFAPGALRNSLQMERPGR
jgi:hypothetical protein